jgi:hypothetical protein
MFTQHRVRQMHPVEAAYVGAMIDGEGCIRIQSPGNSYGIDLSNTDVEIISALVRATGIGTVYPHGNNRKNRQPQWKVCFSWRVHRKLDALEVARQCAPYSTKCQRLLKLEEDCHK